jgi:hypothetical protein
VYTAADHGHDCTTESERTVAMQSSICDPKYSGYNVRYIRKQYVFEENTDEICLASGSFAQHVGESRQHSASRPHKTPHPDSDPPAKEVGFRTLLRWHACIAWPAMK